LISALEPTRAIAWKDLDASALSPEARKIVGESWRERAKQEHLAVGAFSMIGQELAALGCDPIVLALVTKASWDEVRHAEVCRKMAVAMLGENEVPTHWRGVPKIPAHEGASDEARVLLHVAEMCCLSETMTGVYFTEMLARATNPIARTAIASLLEDELDHGKVGWAYLGARKRDGTLEGLAEALPELLDRTVVRALVPRPDAKDDSAMEAFGYLGNNASCEMILRAAFEVILPGFEAVAIDTSAARAHLNDRRTRA